MYAAFDRDRQVESLTFVWCPPERVAELVREVLAGNGVGEPLGHRAVESGSIPTILDAPNVKSHHAATVTDGESRRSDANAVDCITGRNGARLLEQTVRVGLDEQCR